MKQSVAGFGHEPTVALKVPESPECFDVAIVGLASEPMRAEIPKLVALGVHVIGHAGHKDKELHALGRELGCHELATNGQITFKIGEMLEARSV